MNYNIGLNYQIKETNFNLNDLNYFNNAKNNQLFNKLNLEYKNSFNNIQSKIGHLGPIQYVKVSNCLK